MPATLVQSNSGTTGTATAPTSVTASLGSNPASTDNDLLLVMSSDGTITTPSGWALDRSQVNNQGHYTFRRSAEAGVSSYIITVSASTCWWLAEMQDLDPTPLDQAISTGSGTAATTRSSGSTGTTAQADEFALVSFSASVAFATGTPATWSGYTNGFSNELVDLRTTKTSGTNVGLAVVVRDLISVTSYETTGTLSLSQASTGMLLTYKVSAGPPAPTVLRGLLQSSRRLG